MSTILIALAHPNPNSLNHAIARTAENKLAELGHQEQALPGEADPEGLDVDLVFAQPA